MINENVTIFSKPSDVSDLIGKVVGSANIELIDQATVDDFARVTQDNQWIHVDVEAAKSGPFGSTIAHGFLVLSLIPALGHDIYKYENTSARLNYGLNRVRFPSPLVVGDGIIDTVKVVSAEDKAGGQLVQLEHSIRRKSDGKTVCVAEFLTMVFWNSVPAEH